MKKTLLIIFVSLYLIGCKYQFSEDYFNEIKVTKPTFSLSLTNFVNGEVLKKSKNLQYNYEASDKNALSFISFYIDGKLMEQKHQPKGDFFINIDNLENGKHDLKIEYFFKSGTGSLAEISGNEGYKAQEEFLFNIDKSVTSIEISKVEHKEGSIFVSWEVPEDIDKYLEAKLIIQEGYIRREVSLLDNDLIKKGVFRDSLSTKFKVNYSIGVRNYYNENYSTVNNFYVKDSTVSVTHEIIDENNYKLTWNEHPLYGNFDHYKLTYTEEKTVSNRGGELIITTPLTFGGGTSYSLTMEREHNYIEYKTELSGSVIFGTPIDNFEYKNLVYDDTSNFFFATKLKKEDFGYYTKVEVFKLNAEDLSINQKMSIENIFIESKPNLLLDNNHNLVLDLGEKSLVINSSNLSIEKTIHLRDYKSKDTPYNAKIRYRGDVVIIDSDNGFNQINIYNTKTKKLIQSIKKEYASDSTQDFNYFTVERNVYKIDNETINLIYTHPKNEPRLYKVKYIPYNNSLLLKVGGGDNSNSKECVFVNLGSKNTLVVKGSKEASSFNYDKTTEQILFINDKSSGNITANILNLKTGSLKKLLVRGTDYRQDYYLFKNSLYLLNHNFYLKNYF